MVCRGAGASRRTECASQAVCFDSASGIASEWGCRERRTRSCPRPTSALDMPAAHPHAATTPRAAIAHQPHPAPRGAGGTADSGGCAGVDGKRAARRLRCVLKDRGVLVGKLLSGPGK